MQSLLSKHNAVVHGFEFVDPNDCVGKTMTLRRTPGGTSEVAVLIGEEARGFDPREIVIERADGVHAQIPAMSSFWEPLQYTLLNPRGEGHSGMGPRHETKNGVVYIAVHESGPVLQTRYRVKPNRQRRHTHTLRTI